MGSITIAGRFGEIYHAKLKRQCSTLEVVIKTLKKIDDKKEQSDFLKEQSVMSELMHPNIVRFYGLIIDDGILLKQVNKHC